MQVFTHAAVDALIDLAIEKGCFRDCDKDAHSKAIFWDNIKLPTHTIERIKKHGIRNSALFSIQPNGNTSIFANIISGGCEPEFLHEYVRTVILSECPDFLKEFCPKYWEGDYVANEYFKSHKEGGDNILKYKHANGVTYKIDKNRGLTKEVLCESYGVRKLKRLNKWNPKDEFAVTTNDISVQDHIDDMCGFAKWIDAAISKTVNIPNNYPYDDFKDLYLTAYKTGFLKGITTYRSWTMTTVLSAKSDTESKCAGPKKR